MCATKTHRFVKKYRPKYIKHHLGRLQRKNEGNILILCKGNNFRLIYMLSADNIFRELSVLVFACLCLFFGCIWLSTKICILSEFRCLKSAIYRSLRLFRHIRQRITPALYYLFMLLSSLCNLLYDALSPQ